MKAVLKEWDLFPPPPFFHPSSTPVFCATNDANELRLCSQQSLLGIHCTIAGVYENIKKKTKQKGLNSNLE